MDANPDMTFDELFKGEMNAKVFEALSATEEGAKLLNILEEEGAFDEPGRSGQKRSSRWNFRRLYTAPGKPGERR